MKKLLVFAMGILVLIGCRKEYRTPSTENQNPEKPLQTVPKCGNEVNAEFAAKLLKARKSRDEQEKISAKKPKPSTEEDFKPTVIFLDANGHIVENTIWNLFNSVVHKSIDCRDAGLTKDQMNAIIKSAAEDFSPFHIIVTADEKLFNQTPKEKRLRVIITRLQGLEHIFPYAGGFAAIGSLWWKDDTPSFVFADVFYGITANIAEVISHESGHMIGLHHQSEFYENGALRYEYHPGFILHRGILWKPIMGSSYFASISGWMSGRSFQGTQNDLELLGVVGFKTDGVSNNLSTAKHLKFEGAEKKVTFNELINNPTDADFYSVQSGYIKFSAVGSGNCDLKIIVYNSKGKVIAKFNDENSVGISEKIIKTEGQTIYLKVEAHNLLTDQIQSAGQYTLVVNKI